MKNDLKMKFEKGKEKKENIAGSLSAQTAQAAHQPSPRRPTSPLSLFFFPRSADDRAPPVSLFPSPSFLLLHLAAQPIRHRHAIPTAPRHFPSFPPYQASQLRQLTFPAINWNRYPSISTVP
jgi:hypothetical protein